MPIDTIRASAQYRGRTLDRARERILMTKNLSGSSQEQDLSAPVVCGGLGRIRHFHRTPHRRDGLKIPFQLTAAQTLGLGEALGKY